MVLREAYTGDSTHIANFGERDRAYRWNVTGCFGAS